MWLAQTEDDRKTGLLKEKKVGSACFFFSVGVQKAVDALGLKNHLEYWGQSILRLLLRIQPDLAGDDPRCHCCRRPGCCHIPTRYPNAFPEGTASERYGPEVAAEAEASGPFWAGEIARAFGDWGQKVGLATWLLPEPGLHPVCWPDRTPAAHIIPTAMSTSGSFTP